MRKTFCYSLFFIFLFAVTSCGLFDNQDTHPGYVRHCIRIMDRHGLKGIVFVANYYTLSKNGFQNEL